MSDWNLSFSHPHNITIQAAETVIGHFVGPVTTEIGELNGNPRDFYTRNVTIKGERDDVKVELWANQSLRGADEPEPLITHVYVKLTAPYKTKLATWSALTSGFATIGCTSRFARG